MSLETWFLYAVAVFVLTVTPGPSVLMCVTSGVNHGARRTFFSALGSVTAVLVIMVCSALSVGAVLATSETLFYAIKWFGVVYLLYIGVSALRSKESSFEVPELGKAEVSQRGPTRLALYVRGFLVGASNPKALLFFTAFFPQFLNPAAPQLAQFFVLGFTFVCFELFWLMFYASFAARMAPWLRTPGRARMFNRISGCTFIGAALLLALVKRTSKE
jgi:threonine/homoserine/homoserine lactone efflux protein